MNKIFIYLFLGLVGFISCKNSTQEFADTSVDMPLPQWAESAVLYEVNTRNVTAEGTFSSFKTHLPRLKSMGIDILWFMPIHPISMKNRKATNGDLVESIEDPEERAKYLGSPYAVADYKAVNPDLGTMQDFKDLVDDAHKRGMKVILDWVPNHTGWDNSWITEHPEWYTKDKDGNITDPINYETGEPWGWTDVADLNYDNQEMRRAMLESMKYWINEADIDGFRVDVAHGIPNDFWDQMKEEFINLPKELFLLAESEVPYHRNSGAFHATYGWSFHHLLNDIARGEKDVSDIKKWLKKDNANFKKGFSIHFTSNHDENSWAGTVFDRMGEAHQALAVLAATFDGMPLIYNGQEIPLDFRIPFFEKDTIEWNRIDYADFYKTLFDFKHECMAIRNHDGADVEFLSDNKKVLAFRRKNHYDEAVVIINLSDEPQEYSLNTSLKDCREIFTSVLTDIEEGKSYEMDPWEYIVLDGSYGR
jgi:glycosidase